MNGLEDLPDLERLRQGYRPDHVRMLFVGESPPAGGTFFYRGNSNLARYTCEAFNRAYGDHVPVEQFPTAFRDRGCYLVDLCPAPVDDKSRAERRASRQAGVAGLARALVELAPKRILVVMKAIEPEVGAAVAIAGLAGIPSHVLPFPAQGNQRKYVVQLAELLKGLKGEELTR